MNPEERVAALRAALSDIEPAHDSPIGIVHPYWARKPLNVLETVICHLTEEGGLVADPFMGSGTTVFASLRLGRRAVGGDISALSHYLVGALLDVVDNASRVLPELRRILDEHSRIALPWFQLDDSYVERIRYSVSGTFDNGEFELTPTEGVTKKLLNSKWTRRSVRSVEEIKPWAELETSAGSEYGLAPIDFEKLKLKPNSRIAIPEGANLSHYFTPRNRASINALIASIRRSPMYPELGDALSLILSASLPLLRLSDKKASSQWPFWRPKENLTSRNPVIVLQRRMKLLEDLVTWAADNLKTTTETGDQAYRIYREPAQNFTSDLIGASADLVLTDPPYGDQVPYGEYAALWTGILELDDLIDADLYEVVKSDAAHRKEDSAQYDARLEAVFIANARVVKEEGFLAWFYQDQDLHCWSTVSKAAAKAGMRLVDVIPLPKQRRSLKSVTSPNATLDGDLLCIYVRQDQDEPKPPKTSSIESLSKTLSEMEGSHFDHYATMVEIALKQGLIEDLAQEFGTVKRALTILMG